MDIQKVINQLENEWELETGSLGKLREGLLDEEGLDRLYQIIKELEMYDIKAIDRKIISLIWFIPMFMQLQVERVQEKGFSIKILANYQGKILDSLLKILGVGFD